MAGTSALHGLFRTLLRPSSETSRCVDCNFLVNFSSPSGVKRKFRRRGQEEPTLTKMWSARELLPFRSRIQMIFQDAATAMNPRFSSAEVISGAIADKSRSRSEQQS